MIIKLLLKELIIKNNGFFLDPKIQIIEYKKNNTIYLKYLHIESTNNIKNISTIFTYHIKCDNNINSFNFDKINKLYETYSYNVINPKLNIINVIENKYNIILHCAKKNSNLK